MIEPQQWLWGFLIGQVKMSKVQGSKTSPQGLENIGQMGYDRETHAPIVPL
jgi:hypothetical protein